ncbi:hypothetical protein JCM11641_001132 [Rhodosporidiobolus odoratus]
MPSTHHYGSRNGPLQTVKQAPQYDDLMSPKSSKPYGGNGGETGRLPNGLAISYDMHGRDPVYRADIRRDEMGWESNQRPIPRNQQDGNFLTTHTGVDDPSTRPDSVFDAYVDMYADYYSENDDGGEDTEGDYAYEVPQTEPLRTPNARDRQEAFEGYELPSPQPQAREPWDERGKTGLYGGGGRGADDRETGWVRDYAFSPPEQPGFEEDLQFEGDDSDLGPKQRGSSHEARGHQADDERRRSSSETAPSSQGPITPSSVNYNPQLGNPKYADSGYRSAGSPPRPAPTPSNRPAQSHTHHRTAFATPARPFSPAPPMPTPARSARVAPPPTQPVHTIDPSLVKKKAGAAAIPTPSAPMPVKMQVAPPIPSVKVNSAATPERARRKSGFSKWSGRSKKPPTISAPILPDGFVEALGMETFALYPGCKPPAHAILAPSLRDSTIPPAAATRSASPALYRPSAPTSIRSATPPPMRKAAPRPQNTGARDQPTSSLEVSPPRPRRAPSPAPSAVRLPLDALRDDASNAGSDAEDVFRRLSKESDGSCANPSQSLTHHRKFFDGLRHGHGRHEEVQANRGVVATNAPAIPPVPSTRHPDSPSSYNTPQTYSPQPSVGSGNSTTVNGFRNPWSAPPASSRSSMHSQRTTHGNRTSYHNGSGVSDRYSMASTAVEHDFRKGSHVSARARLSQQYGYERERSSSVRSPPLPSIVADDEDEYPSPPLRNDRSGSASSAYSEVSEAPPSDDFHPRAHPGYKPSSVVGQLRKNSAAASGGHSLAPPHFHHHPSSPSSSASSAHSYQTSTPVAPRNLSRRHSHVYGGGNGRGNKFGGAGVGGPKDVASLIPKAVTPQTQHVQTIGTTGFRNPFG